jgi:hypothetical protein
LTSSTRSDTPGDVDPESEKEAEQPAEGPGLEGVELGVGKGFREIDDRGEPLVMARPKPRGLLPVPPEVEAVVTREEARLLKERGIVPTPEARRRMVDSLTLQYYYEGFDVAYRATPAGAEVLAVGHEEIGRLVRGMSQEELLTIDIGQP